MSTEDIKLIQEKLKNVQDIELQQLIYQLIKDNLNLQNERNVDPLTGLYNRRILEEIRQNSSPTISIMCDIDNFKEINDTYGHDKGDYVIQKIGSIFKKKFAKY